MHGENISFAYGIWSLVVVNVGLFAFFLISFLTPVRKREWRSMGATLAFFVALFTEMYGFPLTIYILTGVFGSKYPVLNPFSHASGHLWLTFFGGGSAMMTVIHLVSNGMVIAGFAIMWKGWKLIHAAKGELVTGRSLCICEASSVFRSFHYHDWHVNSMADYNNCPHVSRTHFCILPSVKKRRK